MAKNSIFFGKKNSENTPHSRRWVLLSPAPSLWRWSLATHLMKSWLCKGSQTFSLHAPRTHI